MILGILGGMGPESTLDLFGKIINLTDAEKDQEHLHIVIDNNSQIPDRTRGIMGVGEDPKIEMIRSAIKLEYMGADYIAIACNTAHYYYEDIVKFTKVKVIHMIEELAIYLKKNHPHNKKYLLLATEGTYKSQIYNNIFGKYDLCILEPNEQDKKNIMDWAYSVKSSEINTNKEEFEALVHKYTENYNVPVILGCTELPLLVEKLNINNGIYIDPTWVLAKHCVELAKS
ncbi:MAG: aspartate/glutamate racemase family protein [Tissierellia bacterium]|nr:aspartate/glutamate racemase family protein [Tissierellia bacterium]